MRVLKPLNWKMMARVITSLCDIIEGRFALLPIRDLVTISEYSLQNSLTKQKISVTLE